MALTSLVPSYPSNPQPNEFTTNTFGFPPYSNVTQFNISAQNALNYVNSVDVQQNVLLSTAVSATGAAGSPQVTFYPTVTQPTGYYAVSNGFTGHNDAFRLMQPGLHAMLNAYPASIHTSSINGCENLSSFHHASQTLVSASAHVPDQVDTTQVGETLTSISKHDGISLGIIDTSSYEGDELASTCNQDACMIAYGKQQNGLLIIRLLMSGKEVGSIIGKRGENVKKYREQSLARINISDGSSPERIVTVTGTAEQIGVAFTLMSQKFEDDFTHGLLRMGDDGPTCPPVTLRLLVPGTQCGSIIGKGGSRIKDIRELTGASIQVASEALPSSTERTVTISGTAKAIAKCIGHLCEIFLESPVKGPVIPYRPKPAFNNQSIVCPSTSFSPGLVAQTFGFPSSKVDQGNQDANYTTCSTNQNIIFTGSTPLPVEPSSASESSINQSYINQFGPACYLPITGSGSVTQSLGASNENTSPVGRNSTVVQEIVTDPVQLSAAMGYSEFPLPQATLLNTMHSGVMGTTPLAHTILNPLANPFPQLSSINPGVLSLFNSAISPTSLLCSAKDEKYNSALSAARYHDTSSELSHDHSMIDLQTFGRTLPFGSSSGLLSNASTHGLANTSINPLPILQNKASLLGLPLLPPPVIGPNAVASLYNGTTVLEDSVIMKEIIISNELIGCIIGKGGSTVNEIRNLSKAQVKISNCEDGAKERKITLSGSPQAVHLAHYLINNRISTELFAGMIAIIGQ